jgi:hypothetical protein
VQQFKVLSSRLRQLDGMDPDSMDAARFRMNYECVEACALPFMQPGPVNVTAEQVKELREAFKMLLEDLPAAGV